MVSFSLASNITGQIGDLYRRMEQAYDLVARQLDFTCQGCSDNCCDSYFLHHTYVEWAYLWVGLRELGSARLKVIESRAVDYAAACEAALTKGERPQVMCPLNEEGSCSLYRHRLMICRMHGVPSSLTFPNGKVQRFPGCFRCQEMLGARPAVPTVERAALFRELVILEQALLGSQQLPKVKAELSSFSAQTKLMPSGCRKTIADMILSGPPSL